MAGISIKEINKDINERMSTHINSMCATEDEVSIAYLLCRIDDFKKVINEVHSWAVCGAIAPAKDLMRNLPKIVEITTIDFDR